MELAFRTFLRNYYQSLHGHAWETKLSEAIEAKDPLLLKLLEEIRDTQKKENLKKEWDILTASSFGQLKTFIFFNWKPFSERTGLEIKNKKYFANIIEHIGKMRNCLYQNNPVEEEDEKKALDNCDILLKMLK